ncbi:hypothetical protein ACFC5X_27800 [Streptomyces sp. NPDC055952]|uniref:hypothetical protein n=1 Tax=Streptomyces sp. NPDC055952 TaxID=3345663 RepID=UPI0035DCFD88
MRQQLRRASKQLAWDANTQIEYITGLAVGPDELALQFDDVFRVASGMVTEGYLSEDLGALLTPVDEMLREMTQSAQEEWSIDAVRHSARWAHLRDLALAVLQYLEDESGSD